MKKKIFSILFALVLVISFSLVTAVPVGAQDGDVWYVEGSATWSTEPEPVKTGDYSAKFYVPDSSDLAIVYLPIDIAVGDIYQLSFWEWISSFSSGYWHPAFVILAIDLDDDGDLDFGIDEVIADGDLGNDGYVSYGSMVEVHEDRAYWEEINVFNLQTQGSTFCPEWLLGEDTAYNDNRVKMIAIAMGDSYKWKGVTAYIDHLTINGETYDLEPPPPATTVYVDAAWSSQADVNTFDPSLIWQYDAFAIIQDGINAAAEGATVYVAPGTYSTTTNGEAFPIDAGKYNLTITSTGATEDTVIVTDKWGFRIQQGFPSQVANNVTIDGFKIVGSDVAVYTYHVENPRITNNIVTGATSVSSNATITLSTGTVGAVIEGNIIDSCEWGLYVATGVSDTKISKNTITNIVNDAIVLGTGTMSGITISKNEISNNRSGVYILSDADFTDVAINYNNIYSNTDCGIKNEAPSLVNATNNWWGAASGPYHPVTNAAGLGNAVSDYVNYDQWLVSGPGSEGTTPCSGTIGAVSSVIVVTAPGAVSFGTFSIGDNSAASGIDGTVTYTQGNDGADGWQVTAKDDNQADDTGHMLRAIDNHPLTNELVISGDKGDNYFNASGTLSSLTYMGTVSGAYTFDAKQVIESGDPVGNYSITIKFIGTLTF